MTESALEAQHRWEFKRLMKIRFGLILLFCFLLAVFTLRPVVAVDRELTVGSKAPALEIEHWIQDGNGFFKPVKDFEKGKVYVVEFWATWCGPCVASMPHLAELQNKYRGEGLQIVSVTDESVDEVNALLGTKNEAGKTYAQITSAYSLTSDPDGSVSADYMEAAGQNTIPMAFVVGKSGLIEWYGHPAELDQTVEAVLNGSWDRKQYKAILEVKNGAEQKYAEIQTLAEQGNFKEAFQIAERQLKLVKPLGDEQLILEWTGIRFGLRVHVGPPDEEVLAYFRSALKERKGDAYAVAQFGYQVAGMLSQKAQLGPLPDEAISAIEAEVDGAENDLKPLIYNTLAILNDATGKLDAAVKAQESAIEFASERQKTRLVPMLEELKAKAARKK